MDPAARDLYELDFFEWTTRNADLLRCGRLGDADVARIAEELEDMGKRERRALANRTEVLLRHLLKWNAQPQRRSRSWNATIGIQRQRIARLLQDSPSLRGYLDAELQGIYCNAAVNAAVETGLERSIFPAECPFTLDEILSPRFLP